MKKITKYVRIAFIAAIFVIIICSATNSNGDSGDPIDYSDIDISGEQFSGREVVIRYNETRQTIDGFGGSNAWTGLPSNSTAASEVVKLLFSKTEGAGFTILRNRIPFRERLSGDSDPGLNDGFVRRNPDNSYDFTEADGVKTFNLNWNSWDLSGTRTLITRIKNLSDGPGNDLVIMSTPWTPPNNRVTQWKENVTGAGGNLNGNINWNTPDIWGRLKRAHYNDYADLLADYVKNFEARMGYPLAILSIQNEPNMKVSYESCYWSGEDLRDFLKVINDRFPKKGISLTGTNRLGIMAPEFENYDVNFNQMIKPMLDDSVSGGVLTHIALHQYNAGWDSTPRAGTKAFPGITESGKRFWQTEVSTLEGSPHEPKTNGMDNALFYARMIHFDMTLAQTNAFMYWWLWTNRNDNNYYGGSLITVNGSTVNAAMRLFTMGQYSRFIRPGWVRIDCNTEPAAGVYVSAYKNPASKEIAIVVINDTNNAVNVKLNLEASDFSSLAAWRTRGAVASESEKISSLGKLSVEDGNAYAISVPKSVTTFYGNVK